MWVWVNSGSWWWTGRPGVLRIMGSQRVGHDWATELNWTEDVSNSLQIHGLQCARLPCPSLSPRVCSYSCRLSQMQLSNHLILHCPFLLLPSIFPSIWIFSNELTLSIRWPSTAVSASASVLPMNIQDWFPLGLTHSISLLSKGLLRVFSSTTVQKHPFFYIQASLWSNSLRWIWLKNWFLKGSDLIVTGKKNPQNLGHILFLFDWISLFSLTLLCDFAWYDIGLYIFPHLWCWAMSYPVLAGEF